MPLKHLFFFGFCFCIFAERMIMTCAASASQKWGTRPSISEWTALHLVGLHGTIGYMILYVPLFICIMSFPSSLTTCLELEIGALEFVWEFRHKKEVFFNTTMEFCPIPQNFNFFRTAICVHKRSLFLMYAFVLCC